MHFEINQEVQKALPPEEDAFGCFFRLNGTAHREVIHHLTDKDQLGDLHFYVRRHLGQAIALLRLCLVHKSGNKPAKMGQRPTAAIL